MSRAWQQLREYYRDVLDGGSFTPWGDAPTGSMIYMAEPEYLKTGAAYEGNNVNRYLAVGDDAALRPHADGFSCAFWCKDPSTGMAAVDKGAALNAGPTAEWGFKTSNGTSGVNRFAFYNSLGTPFIAQDTVRTDDGSWHLIFGVYDPVAGTVAVQSDLNTEVTTAFTGTPRTGETNDLNIGRSTGALAYFSGDIAQVLIFSGYALTSADRTWLYNSGSGRTRSEIKTRFGSNITAGYALHEKTGLRADFVGSNDLTSYNNPGSVQGPIEDEAVDSAPVAKWSDRLGNGDDLVQTTVADQPIYDSSEKALDFDGVNDYIGLPALLSSPLSDPMEFFAVAQRGTGINKRHIFDCPAGATNTTRKILGYNTAGSQGYLFWNGSGYGYSLQYDSLKHVFTLRLPGSGNDTLRDGGTQIKSIAAGVSTWTGFRVGANALGGENWDGTVAYVAMVPSLDDDYRDAVEAYLKTYYGVS